LRVAALIALAVSAALYVDYTSAAPSFCSADSACGTVRRSGFGYIDVSGLPLVPVPILGVAGFAVLLAVSLLRGEVWRRRVLPALGVTGGVIGVLLVAIQAVKIGAFCAWCVAADSSAVVVAVTSVFAARAGPGDERLAVWGWATLGVLAVAAPILWPRLRVQPPVPATIAKYYQPGKINVVEFADFECPFCRALHTRLKALIKEYPGQVNFVRLNLPLERHPHARDAARAWLCAIPQGKGEEMADRLFTAEDLSTRGLRHIAVELGLDIRDFDRCMVDPRTDATIDRQGAILRDAGFEGLPTTYVGSRRIVGAAPDGVFRDAFERARRGDGETGVPGPIYVLVVVLLAGGIVAGARRRAQ
jgi:predicted DsbA family dithiol-disulfide isomerase/uncharacterized membrane protein